jgi:hypothetical protein
MAILATELYIFNARTQFNSVFLSIYLTIRLTWTFEHVSIDYAVSIIRLVHFYIS